MLETDNRIEMNINRKKHGLRNWLSVLKTVMSCRVLKGYVEILRER